LPGRRDEDLDRDATFRFPREVLLAVVFFLVMRDEIDRRRAKLIPRVDVSTHCSAGASPAEPKRIAADTAAIYRRLTRPKSGRSALGTIENLANRSREILHAGAGHNDRVPPAVGFFGDAQEFSAFVLPELNVKMLSLDLQFSRFDDVIHA
jgi:hypothetical protein